MFEESKKNGYIPHGGMAQAVCPRCNGTVFDSFPQGMPAEGLWTHEYVCAKCGNYFGIQVRRD